MIVRHFKFDKVGKQWNMNHELRFNSRKIDLVVIHHIATKDSIEVNARDIDKWHLKRWGKHSGIGYHFYIKKNGTVQYGRDISTDGAHIKGRNETSIGVALEGGLNGKNEETIEQISSLVLLVTVLKRNLKNKVQVRGHREVAHSGTECPWINMEEVRKMLDLLDEEFENGLKENLAKLDREDFGVSYGE